MGAITGGSPNTFQANIQQTEAQNEAEVQQRREAQEALRAERQAQTNETNDAGGANNEVSARGGREEVEQQARAADPNQRVGGNVDVRV